MEIITANSLKHGLVVFQTSDGWSLNVGRATILESKEQVAAALEHAKADAARNVVVDPYPIQVTQTAEGIVPTKLRERIRAEGPTTGNSKTTAPTPHDVAT